LALVARPKRATMKHYHFHVFDGANFTWDAEGMMLPDLGAVVSEAEARARSVMRAGNAGQNWAGWMIDVSGHDDITLFRYPFEQVREVV
jgi:hypothetical protein